MAVLKDLIVHGSSRFLNKIYANQIQAESGFFNKLIAKDLQAGKATVVGLLDVQGQLHTNAWTNSNIATIDGSFYITPTISSAEGTASNISATTIQFVPRNNTFAVVSSLYYYDTSAHEGTWLKYSKVLVTGQVQLNGEWIPLGTILGYLNEDGTANSLVIAGAEDNKHRASPVLAQLVANGVTTSTSLNYRNLKVSLYQRSSSSSNNADAYKFPLGIFMTAMGTNGKTFLDIYGGGNALTTTYGGYADPNVRIGNLSGLPAVGNQTPAGWGIYTTNGYFKGTVAADNGYIGGASISNGVLTVPAANVSGELTAATINGSKITANTITASQIATNAITADELAANAVTSAKIKAGEVKATNIASNAVTADKLDATTINASKKLTVGAMTTTDQNNILNSNIEVGGRNLLKNSNIVNTSLSDFVAGGTVIQTISSGTTITLSVQVDADDIVWKSSGNRRIGVASSVTKDGGGTQYIETWAAITGYTSTGVDKTFDTSFHGRVKSTYILQGELPLDKVFNLHIQGITSGTVSVSRPKLEIGNKATDWSPAPEDVDVHKYITDIDSNSGITIKALNGTTGTNTTTANYIKLNTSGLDIYKGGASIASYGDTARIGKTNNSRFLINANSLQAYNSSNKLYFEVSSSGIKYGTDLSSSSTTTTVATTSDVNAVSNVANAALSQSIWYATCDTAAATEEKTATITPTTTAFSLTAGVVVNVKFTNTNSGAIANIKLNVNQTGAKNIKYIYNGSLSNIPSAGYLKTGQVYQFTYDGTYWVVQMMYNTNDNTVDNRIVYFTGKTGAKGIWSYSFFMEDGNGTYQNICTASDGTCTATNYTTATTKIANTNGFKVNSTIYFLANISSSVHGYAANTNISNNNVVFSSYGNVIDSRYSMNTTLTANCLTAYKPWYLVGSVNSSDGLFYLDSTWWTQTPNVTGKVYILGGGVYDSTTSNCRITLYENNQWYVYNGTSLVPYEKYASDQASKTASSYITYVNASNGIKVHSSDDTTDFVQINSSAINFCRNNITTLKIEDAKITIGQLGENKRNVYITDSAVQIRNHTTVLAEYGDSIKLYQPTTTTVAVEISSTGATFTGNVKATSLSTGTKTAAETGKGTFINSNGAIYVGDGSTNNFTVTDTGTITATGANLLTATIGNATNKITIGTGTSGHSSVRYGLTTLSDTSHDGFYIGTDGIALGKGVFKVTNAGALTAKSGSIAGWSFDTNSFKTGTWGTDNSAIICTGTGTAKSVGGSASISGWVFTAGANFGVTKMGDLYANSAHISGALTATSLTINNGATIGGDGASQILNSEIDIGGRNIIYDTGTWSNWSCTDNVVISDGIMTATNTTTGSFKRANGWFTLAKSDIYAKDIVISFDVKKSDSVSLSSCCVQLFTTNKAYKSQASGNITEGSRMYDNLSSSTWQNTADINSSEWTRVYSVPIKMSENFNTSYTEYDYLALYVGISSTGVGSVSYRNLKIELGTKPTDWSPAPEDLDVHKYVTDIDSNKGITIKPADTSGNDYLQINSSAINFYRNNVETLKIEDSAIRVGKLGNNLRNVYITDSAVQIRNNTTVLASFGDTITIGKSDTGHLIITDSNVTSYGKNNLEAVSFGSKNNLSTGIAQVTESLTVMGMTQGNTTYKVVYLGNEASSIVSCYKNGDTSSSISMTLMSDKRYAYNNSSLSFGDQVLITYNTVEQISYLSVGTGNFAGANSITIGQGCSSGNRSLAVGYTSEATGTNSISIGNGNKSSGLESSSFGSNNIAKGDQSTAFGSNNKSNGIDSFCAGNDNIAGGTSSVSFGSNNKSNGFDSFTTGSNNVAGDNCMATGLGTIASGSGTLTCGWYNVQDNGDLFCVGSGSSSSSRSDAFCITTSGNAILQGALYSGSRNGSVTTRKMFVVTSTTLDNQTVNASSSASFSFSVAKSGYVPIATKSVIINNASSSGTASSFCYAYYWGINDSNNFTIGIRNVASGTNAKIKIIVNVLYMANTAL